MSPNAVVHDVGLIFTFEKSRLTSTIFCVGLNGCTVSLHVAKTPKRSCPVRIRLGPFGVPLANENWTRVTKILSPSCSREFIGGVVNETGLPNWPIIKLSVILLFFPDDGTARVPGCGTAGARGKKCRKQHLLLTWPSWTYIITVKTKTSSSRWPDGLPPVARPIDIFVLAIFFFRILYLDNISL